MKLIFHGAAKEVGRSCIELQTQGDRYILDAGIKFKEAGFLYPEKVMNIPDLDGLFISHAHEDHIGALPLFEHYNIICPVFCTKMTQKIGKIMLKDSYKIARIKHLHSAYTKIDLKKVDKSTRIVDYNHRYKHRKIHFTFMNAGHVPGSAMILIESEGKKILYTGDTKLKTTELMKGPNIEQFKNQIDVMICESTYGSRGLPDRTEEKNRFLDKIEETIKRGGSVIIPVFALGRSQDALIMLSERTFNVPIYFDGMSKKLTTKILGTKDPYVNNREILSKMFQNKVILIGSERRRKQATKKQGIFVTTSGMVQGGPVMTYIKEMWHDPRNSILLTGFQCKRTNGQLLKDEGYIYIDGWKTYVKCEVERFDFSGHAHKEDLHTIIKTINPKKLILQHGNKESIAALKEWAEENNFTTFDPEVGDEIEI